MKKRTVLVMLLTALITVSSCFYVFASSSEEPTIEELLARIEALEERVAALEGNTSSSEDSSESIATELTSCPWEAATGDSSSLLLEFNEGGDGTATQISGDDKEELPLTWVLDGEQIIVKIAGDDSGIFTYNNENGTPSLLLYDGDELLMIFTPSKE